MTEHTNHSKNQSEIPGGPEGQDTSENMDDKTTAQDSDITEVLPAQATPPTQELAQHGTQRVPERAAPDGTAPEGPAPEGEVHPAYGVAAAQAEAEASAAAVHDAPAPDDTDLLAPLRDPAPHVPPTPVATTPASGSGLAPAQPSQPSQPVQPAQPAQAVQVAVAARRGPRVGTAVWGLIVIAVGLGILAVSAGVVFDLGVALIVLLGAAGAILVVGSVVSSLRRR
ncbi:hypothetical protein [Promicromonospora soli]|uniref:Uncharacterized protein n=1 Tax=Promicromonospora soli TaxID=2035533 RepID=A0A919KUN5_9MICO|nr:hypothetical protein [Promicromonospora soli]GHH72461.1 hypothetical protein GCM10017772_22030 [Promicromonospora soli]